jgi:CubicO group peptidase (beta-lactamase class C family)
MFFPSPRRGFIATMGTAAVTKEARHGFGLGFAVRREAGLAPIPGSVGEFYWGGLAGTTFWIDPREQMFAIAMIQGPGQREHLRPLFRSLV